MRAPALPVLAERIREARIKGNAVILMLGAHVMRRGAAPLLIDLMERGLLTHIALNGAGAIHDFELAMIGSTCESVARYVRTGEFGLWKETGGINAAAKRAAATASAWARPSGGRSRGDFPYAETSVLATGSGWASP